MVKIAAIIAARMSSHRLPGKSMMEIAGHPLLWHVIERVKAAVDCVIVATPDEEIANFATRQNVLTFIGSEDDVLDRYYQAAVKFGVENIVLINGDEPLSDPKLTKKVVDFYLSHDFDFVCNNLKLTYPYGLTVEVFSFNTLESTWKSTNDPHDREHVTLYTINHPELFKLANVENDCDLSGMRWNVDTRRDLEFVRDVFSHFPEGSIFGVDDILKEYYGDVDYTKINEGGAYDRADNPGERHYSAALSLRH